MAYTAVFIWSQVFLSHHVLNHVTPCVFFFFFSMNMFRRDKGSTAPTPVVPPRPSKEVRMSVVEVNGVFCTFYVFI